MAKGTKSIRTARRKAVLIARPVAGLPRLPIKPLKPLKPLKPPPETALDAFATELRGELDRLTTAVQTLSNDLAALGQLHAALKQRYDQHTHAYTHGNPGSAGSLWVDLKFIRNYLDDDKTLHDGYGGYFRGGPVSGSPPPLKTDPLNP